MTNTFRFDCPGCQTRFKAAARHVGRRYSCPTCKSVVVVPPAPGVEAPTAAPAGPDPALLCELTDYLRSGKPADMVVVQDPAVFTNLARYYEEVTSDPACPRLTYYLLRAKEEGASPPCLVVETGDQAEHDRDWHHSYEPVLKRALPGKTWNDLTRSSYSNHSKPGCGLSSTAGFDRFARQIAEGQYMLERVLRPVPGGANSAGGRPAAPADKRTQTPEELAADLFTLMGGDGGFGNRTRIEEIGEALNEQGGMSLMQKVYYQVRGRGVYFSQDIWDGIGDWRS